MLMVVALGGNAVSLPGHEGNIGDQYAATRAACGPISELIAQGHELILTHGNGPQIGIVMRRVEIAARENIYPLPLDTAVADTEAGMGYMIGQCLMNALAQRGIKRTCTTIITTVRVDLDDPAMSDPTKPIGPFLRKEFAERHAKEDGWTVKEEPSRGWRRVVSSPKPKEIVELPVISKLAAAGEIIVAGGGGGVPVVRDSHGNFRGVEVVIDKDYTSALLATALNADRLLILTGVDRVQCDFGKPTARELDVLTTDEAERLLNQGQFPPGSMGPKIRASIEFLRSSPKKGSEAIITSCERAADALAGKTGTRIVKKM